MTQWRALILFAFAVLALAAPFKHALAVNGATAHHNASVTLDPESGMVEVLNTITLEAEGRVILRLNSAFVVEHLEVKGIRRSPDRHGDTLAIDVGSSGLHTILLRTRANLSTRSAHENPPFLNADGGFLALGWLGHPYERNATYSIKVITPVEHIAVLPGRLMKEARKDGVYEAVFASDIPDNPPVLITGPFEVAEKMLGDVRVRTYFHPELSPLANDYLTDAARFIEHYAQKIGPYPYTGFAMVSGPLPVGVGLPGMTYMGRSVLALPFIRATSLPHEVLHNWWGNAVQVDYATGNWAEGLTSYQADHAQAAAQARDGGREKRLEWLRNYTALPVDRDRPVTAFQTKTHDATQVMGYDKVAYIFHMLNARFGQDAFDRAIRRFYADNRHRITGWAQVQAAFEAESGEDLSAFFDAWLNRPGAPQLALKDVERDGERLTFSLVQSQSGAAYPLTLDATITTAAGEQHLRLEMDKKSQRYTVLADAPPVALAVDPDLDVFRRLSAFEAPPIFRDVTLNADAQLIAPGGNAIARALAEGLMQGPVAETQSVPAPPFNGALIVAGLSADVAPFLVQNNLPLPPPATLDLNAQGLAYVVRDASGRTTLVAMAQDEESLAVLARALPHYKRRSFAVMREGGIADKGVWPTPPGPLTRRLD